MVLSAGALILWVLSMMVRARKDDGNDDDTIEVRYAGHVAGQ